MSIEKVSLNNNISFSGYKRNINNQQYRYETYAEAKIKKVIKLTAFVAAAALLLKNKYVQNKLQSSQKLKNAVDALKGGIIGAYMALFVSNKNDYENIKTDNEQKETADEKPIIQLEENEVVSQEDEPFISEEQEDEEPVVIAYDEEGETISQKEDEPLIFEEKKADEEPVALFQDNEIKSEEEKHPTDYRDELTSLFTSAMSDSEEKMLQGGMKTKQEPEALEDIFKLNLEEIKKNTKSMVFNYDWTPKKVGNENFDKIMSKIEKSLEGIQFGEEVEVLREIKPEILSQFNTESLRNVALAISKSDNKYISEIINAVNDISPEMIEALGEGNIARIIIYGKSSKAVIERAKILDELFDAKSLKKARENSWSVNLNLNKWLIRTESSQDQNDIWYLRAMAPAVKRKYKTVQGQIDTQEVRKILEKPRKKFIIF